MRISDWSSDVCSSDLVNHVDVPERRILDVRPSKASHRTDSFLGVQELLVDKHLANTSDRYDFYSNRLGIQPFQSDFRGFLFNDSQLGLRLFGNSDKHTIQNTPTSSCLCDQEPNSAPHTKHHTP